MNMTPFNGYAAGYIIAQGDIDPAQVRASGNTHSPVLTLPLGLSFRPVMGLSSTPTDLIFTLLTGRIFAGLPDVERIRLGVIDPIPLNKFISGKFPGDIPDSRNLTISLDHRILEIIERHRLKDVQLYAEIEISVLTWGEGPPFTQPKPTDPARLGQAHTLTATLAPLIPQSLWLSNVLKPSGYGEVRIIEIPFGQISKTPFLLNSLAALQKAERFFRAGDYDEAAGQCRVALEGYFEPEDIADPNNKKQVLRKSWVKTLGQETYSWLDSVLRHLKTDTNAPHHNPTPRFSRLDAQMLVTITAVVLAYIERQVRNSNV